MAAPKVILDFKPDAYASNEGLLAHVRFGGLAKRYYKELFDFPPEQWGRLRRAFGKNTFVSDNHTPFVIKVMVVEEKADLLWLYVTEFRLREKT